MNTIDTLIVPALPFAQKHPAVFQKFDALKNGETFLLINDHDPMPLYSQMIAERGEIFSWEYLERGPQAWKVKITKNKANNEETIGQMVARDLSKAAVLKKWGLDFCCGGKKTLVQACREKGIDVQLVAAELLNAKGGANYKTNFQQWEPDFLADYIYNQHHVFYYNEEPALTELMQKVVERHGNHFPELQKLAVLYAGLTADLKEHFTKEERVLFPFIKALVQAKITGNFSLLKRQPSLTDPVHMMEADHEAAGKLLEAMRKLTNDYTPPQNACNSLRFLYHKLAALEEDLHQHVHLENNVLFPKVLAMEKNLETQNFKTA